MKLFGCLILVAFLSGCGSSGIYFKEVEDGIQIRPLGKGFWFFKPKLPAGNYSYSYDDKKGEADFKKEPMKLIDLNFNGAKK